MQRLFLLVLLLVLLGGAWLFFDNFQLEGLDQVTVRRRSNDAVDERETAAVTHARDGGVIRVASFNIQVFDESKASKPRVVEVLAAIVRRFDVVAIQEIRAANQQLLPAFVEQINADGHRYDYVIDTRQGRTGCDDQYAFVFDTATIQVDRSACYNIDDPHDLLHRPPLVCAFRVRDVRPEEAFTFVMINVHTDLDKVEEEVNALAEVYRAVRQASAGEDDIILLGSLNTDDCQLGNLAEIASIRTAISGVATNTRGTKQYDNIVFHEQSTTEFTGRADVFDVMRAFNLTMQQTLEISDHLPVWAEFSIYEHGPGGPVAARPEGRVAH